jgi:hypothetical protein
MAATPADAAIETSAEETEAPSQEDTGFEWAIVEIFGHRRHAGRAREETRFGAAMLRIDVPKVAPPRTLFDVADGTPPEPEIAWETHWYGGSSIFSFTLTDQATVMQIARRTDPAAGRYALPAPDDDDEEDAY